MFTLIHKKSYFPIAPLLKVDMHSHLIPGIDDGSPDVASSLSLLDGMIDLGYEKLIFTPHIMGDLYPNTPDTIRIAFSKLQDAMKERKYSVPVSYAAEYLIDEFFEEKIEQELLCVFGRYLLIETMFSLLPPNIERILFLLKTNNYKPIFAHPERYHFMEMSFESLSAFEKHGCYLQPNILSFTGYYGEREKKLAERLLDMGKVDFLGTDIHHQRHLEAIKHLQLRSKVIKKLEEISYLNLRLIEDESAKS